MRAYCTYFDHRYLPKGLAMIRSLHRHVPEAQIWVLCLSPQAYDMLQSMDEPGVNAIALPDFELGDSGLAQAKSDGRSTVEYYFTLTPSLVLHVMRQLQDAEIVTYLDGDLWFLADPEPVFREMGSSSVLIIPHGFAPEMKERERYGHYNVGWVSFRSDDRGRACLYWWRERTIEWCLDRVDNGRFADQGYLDQFPQLFQGVHVLAHRGANLAPWNVAARKVSLREGIIQADQDSVLFFHFHDLRKLPKGEYLASHGAYKAPLTPLMRDRLYRPYLREVVTVEREIAGRPGFAVDMSIREHSGLKPDAQRWWRGWRSRFRNLVATATNRWHGYVISPEND
jgi:hypothetical protein